MAVGLLLVNPLAAPYYQQGAVAKVLALTLTILVGILIFAGSTLALKAYDWREIRGILRRR